MPDLFHVTDLHLPPGEQIAAGWFGAQVAQPNSPHRVREDVMEAYRVQNTAVSVSRLNCTYAFESLEDAYEYCQGPQRIYHVRPAHADTELFRADMLIVTWIRERLHEPEALRFNLEIYWRSEISSNYMRQARPIIEVLVGGPLEIVKELERPAGVDLPL